MTHASGSKRIRFGFAIAIRSLAAWSQTFLLTVFSLMSVAEMGSLPNFHRIKEFPLFLWSPVARALRTQCEEVW